MENQARWLGIIFVLVGAILWGIAGAVSQRLFEEGIEVGWLVAVRLLTSGTLLLLFALCSKNRHLVFKVWSDRKSIISLLIFSIFGMVAVQYTFMVSIDLGNAAVATLLQYQAPIFIIMYFVLTKVTKLKARDVTAVLLAVTGTFLLLTNGSLNQLAVPFSSVVWGLISGVALAFYTIYAAHLIKKWGSIIVIGWSMLIGGTCVAIFNPPWNVDVSSWTINTIYFLIFVVIFGTLIAFWLFVESLKTLKPEETTLLGTVEPLAAVITSILWLQIPFGEYQMLGTTLILGMIIYLSVFKDKEEVTPTPVLKRTG